jgi:hypothetical protein
VTRLAQLKLDGKFAEITPRGQVKPLHNGSGQDHRGNRRPHLQRAGGGHRTTRSGAGDFIRDVNPVITALGCNAGTCHGAQDGKVGFKLSLRGYDPIFDVRSLKDDLAGRRLNVASPDDSLMLLKSTAGVPHEGGQRTKLGEKYYEILRSWIANGATLDLKASRVVKIDVFPRDPVVQQIGARSRCGSWPPTATAKRATSRRKHSSRAAMAMW